MRLQAMFTIDGESGLERVFIKEIVYLRPKAMFGNEGILV